MPTERTVFDNTLAAAALDAAADMALVVGADGRLCYANEEACRVLGYDRGEISGLNLADIDPLVPPPGQWEGQWDSIRAEASVRVRQTRHRTRDGRLIPVEVKARYAEFDGRGYVFSFARDISRQLESERSLRRSEGLYRQLLDELPIAVMHSAPDGRLLFLNEYGRSLTGYGTADLRDMRAEELYLDAVGSQHLARRLEEEGAHQFELEMRCKDGGSIWVRGKSRLMRDADGEAYYQSIAEDITAEKRQRAKDEALRGLHYAVWDMREEEDIKQLLFKVRQALERMDVPVHGCSIQVVDDIWQPPRVSCYHNFSGSVRWEELSDGVTARTILDIWRGRVPVYRRDLDLQDTNGEQAAIRMTIGVTVRSVLDVPYSHGTLAVNSPMPDAFSEANVESVVQVAEVLSEGFRRLGDLRVLARRAQEAESLAAAIHLVAASREAEAVLDAVVSEAVRLMGCERASIFLYDEGEGVLVPRAQVGHGKDYMSIRLAPGEDMSGRVFANGEPFVVNPDNEAEINKSRSRETEALFRKVVSKTSGSGAGVPLELDGKTIGTLAVGSGRRLFGAHDVQMLQRLGEQAVVALDLTQRAESLEERKGQLERQIEESRRLEAQLRQAQKMEAIGELTAGVAHNFNNLLQIIKGNLYLAADSNREPEIADQLQDADLALERAAELIRHLLVFARHNPINAAKEVELGRVLRYVVDICRKTFDRSIEVGLEVPATPVWIRGDAGAIEQVFLNLCINARDALEGEGGPHRRIDLRLCSAGAGRPARVQVEDNGRGMDRETCERVFEPFFTTKEVGQGTGLGLSTAYGIVGQHGGKIVCSSEEGRGALFEVELPEVMGKEVVQVKKILAPQGAAPIPVLYTVLVVEDEDLVRTSTAHMLERAGYRVLTAADGLEALEVFRQDPGGMDLVLLDLSMPRLSGGAVLEEMRRVRPEIKVVICTGYGPRYQKVGPAAGVLTKPFRREQLLLQVEQVLIEPQKRN
jgi:PAS domain S-box-containing protein